MSLIGELQILNVAFRWDGITRVYRAQQLGIVAVEDKEEWTTADFKKNYNLNGYYLQFSVFNRTVELVSPTGLTNNGMVELVNFLNDPTEGVRFYPIYDIDATVSYEVKSVGTERQFVTTRRALVKPEFEIVVETDDILTTLPAWLNTLKQK